MSQGRVGLNQRRPEPPEEQASALALLWGAAVPPHYWHTLPWRIITINPHNCPWGWHLYSFDKQNDQAPSLSLIPQNGRQARVRQSSVAIRMFPEAWGLVKTLPLHTSSKVSLIRLWAKCCQLLKVSRILVCKTVARKPEAFSHFPSQPHFQFF